jgi:hypothetical protein
MRRLQSAIASSSAGVVVSLALLVRETPYTLAAFMFLGQPLLLLGMLLFMAHALGGMRGRGMP